MPRRGEPLNPVPINEVLNANTSGPIPWATRNPGKQAEIRNFWGDQIPFVSLSITEIQSRDPLEVAHRKAYEAFIANKGPAVIEETSLTIPALEHILPAPFVAYWAEEREYRQKVIRILDGQDRSATARVILSVFDGKEYHDRVGEVEGRIALELRGIRNFGWDDMFEVPLIVDGETVFKAFAEMTSEEKAEVSMRTRAFEALNNEPFNIGTYIYQMDEPYPNEIKRIRQERLTDDERALQFAFDLEAFGGANPANTDFLAPNYAPLIKEENPPFYVRYSINPDSPDLGILLTDIELDRIKLTSLDEPEFYQMGPERRKLALAMRAQYFKENHNPRVYEILEEMEEKIARGEEVIPARTNRTHPAIEQMLGAMYIDGQRVVTKTVAFDEIGYRKLFSPTKQSRREARRYGLFNKIGKYPRKCIGLGSMPTVSGIDTITTAAVGHMLAFIPRNSLFADNVDRQIQMAVKCKEKIRNLGLDEKNTERIERNIGVSLGVDHPEKILADAERLYSEAGIKVFRLYTINAGPQVIETARLLRQRFGDEIEIFVGKVADVYEAALLGLDLTVEDFEKSLLDAPFDKDFYLQLVDETIAVDGLDVGHGGGRNCDSAGNQQGVTTVEETMEITTDARFNKTTLLIEGGVGRGIGIAMMMGADGVLYNQRTIRGLESPAGGDIYIMDRKTDKLEQANPGEASPPTQIVEGAQSDDLAERRFDDAGRTETTEGVPGFSILERKTPSMTFNIAAIGKDAAKMLADLGCRNIADLRRRMQNPRFHPFRHLSGNAQFLGSTYRNNK